MDRHRLDEVGIMAHPLEFHTPKLPGLGDVEWGRFFSTLNDTGYHGAGVRRSRGPRLRRLARAAQGVAGAEPGVPAAVRGVVAAELCYQRVYMAEQDVPPAAEPEAASSEQTKRARGQITLKVSEKGALSVYGLGRFPVTLYKEQWLRLLTVTDQIKAFIQENDDKLKKKEA